MKPLRFAFGEIYREEFAHRTRHAFDHLYLEPKEGFKFRLSAKLPKGEYPESAPFGNGALLKSIGNFGININKALDRDNQIIIHIPDAAGRSVYVHGNNILTVQHVKESIDAILTSYAENREDKNFNPYTVSTPAAMRSRRFLDCLTAFTSASFEAPVKEVILKEILPPPETIMDRYLSGIDIDRLTKPEIHFDSFELDHGFIEIHPSDFEQSEKNNGRCNTLYFDDEKKYSSETQEAFARHWDIKFFEGGKAEYFNRFKSFIQNKLSVTVSISDYSHARIELRGQKENVMIAKKIGIRAVDLLNEGKPLPDKDGKSGKPLDKEWLENALSDARHHFAVKSMSERLGVTMPPVRNISRKAEPKDYPDFHLSGFMPA